MKLPDSAEGTEATDTECTAHGEPAWAIPWESAPSEYAPDDDTEIAVALTPKAWRETAGTTAENTQP